MKRLIPVLSTVLGALAAGCAPTVALEVPASPAVALRSDALSVVARERDCQAPADALASELARSGWITVDPAAPLRLELFGCGQDEAWTVETEDGPDGPRRRARVASRAHAVVVVSDRGRVVAHLIGTGRDDGATDWNPRGSAGVGKASRRRAIDELALDLSRQVSPLPTLVARRVWPNAPAETSRGLTTRAVEAEREGDLQTALRLAEAAFASDPNPRTSGYVASLKRRATESPAP